MLAAAGASAGGPPSASGGAAAAGGASSALGADAAAGGAVQDTSFVDEFHQYEVPVAESGTSCQFEDAAAAP